MCCKIFFKNLKTIKNNNYNTLRDKYILNYNLTDATKPIFKKICYSTVRVHLASHILLNSLDILSGEITIYKNMTTEQKKELKMFKLKISKIFSQTTKIMDDISDLI